MRQGRSVSLYLVVPGKTEPNRTNSFSLSAFLPSIWMLFGWMDIILHLIGLNFISHFAQTAGGTFWLRCEVCWKSQKKVLYHQHIRYRWEVFVQFKNGLQAFKLIHNEFEEDIKSVGDSKQSCRTPIVTLNHWVIWTLIENWTYSDSSYMLDYVNSFAFEKFWKDSVIMGGWRIIVWYESI